MSSLGAVDKGTMPLSGIRVADFSWVAAGPWCTRYLAIMGAEVIKIESQHRIDMTRSSGPFSDGIAGVNLSGYFNMWNQSKRSCTINLASEKGRDIARRLVKISDIVVENFSLGTMEKFGLSYSQLKQLRPDLIMLSSSGFGRTGPQKHYVAYGRNLQAASGLSYLTGYPGAEMGVTIIWSDYISALTNAFAILVALHHRRRTGMGQYIDVSMLEATAMQLPDAIMDYAMNGRNWSRMGNQSNTAVPHNCYRCLGDDKWVAIEVTSEQWPDFCRAIGNLPWCHDMKFADLLQRLAHRDELDRLVESWTSQRTVEDVVSRLQRYGIAAGPSTDLEDLFADESLFDRRTLVRVAHPEAGVKVGPGLPWRMSRVLPDIQGAPLLGGDNRYVFCELLGMSEDEVATLAQEGAIA